MSNPSTIGPFLGPLTNIKKRSGISPSYCSLRHRETKSAHLSAHHHRWNAVKLFIPAVHAACHYQFQAMILVGAKHPQMGKTDCGKRPENDRAQLQCVPKCLQCLVLRGQFRRQILVPRIDRPHEPVALHRITLPLDSQQLKRFARQLARSQLSSRSAQKFSDLGQHSHERETPTGCLADGNARNTMNWAATVTSATSGAPICFRIRIRSTTMQTHCQRDWRSRSNLPVSASSLPGARPCRLGDSARARKQATAKKPESRISASNACVLTRTSTWVIEIRSARPR